MSITHVNRPREKPIANGGWPALELHCFGEIGQGFGLFLLWNGGSTGVIGPMLERIGEDYHQALPVIAHAILNPDINEIASLAVLNRTPFEALHLESLVAPYPLQV